MSAATGGTGTGGGVGGGAEGSGETGGTKPLVFVIGDRELVIRRRYEALSTVNDILVGLWFLVGSFLFLSAETTYAGTWLFILGSVELLIRPVIRFSRRIHLQRLPGGPAAPLDGHDF